MVLTIAGTAAVGMAVLALPLGAAVLLGALLAPTDPVLASDVQVSHEHDTEPVRFSLTGEAGLNDGTAFPFVMLGLGLMGAHGLGEYGWRWLVVDLVWAVAAGLGVGTLCGAGIGKLVIYLRRVHREAVGLDEFLALGLIALSYGIALLIHAYGFLAVFAAGLSVRRIEREHSDVPAPADVEHAETSTEEQATHPDTAPTYMARAVLGFNEQLERLGELAVVLVVGAMLSGIEATAPGIWLALGLFVVIRPAATLLTLVRVPLSRSQRAFIAWFGVRGIGSIYYLAYALSHGVPGPAGRMLADVTLVVVAGSIVLHGISVTPLMQRYSVSPSEHPKVKKHRPRRSRTSHSTHYHGELAAEFERVRHAFARSALRLGDRSRRQCVNRAGDAARPLAASEFPKPAEVSCLKQYRRLGKNDRAGVSGFIDCIIKLIGGYSTFLPAEE